MIPSLRKSLASLKNDLAAKRGQQHARRRRSAMAKKHPLAAQQEALEARQLLSAIQVTTDADSGTGSLREAIATANANKQADTITFASSVTSITLTGGELVLSETGPGNRTTIKGPVSISGNNASRIFTVKPGVFAEFSSLTLTNGRATGDGGAIDSQGELAILGTTVKDSFATGKSGAIQLTAGTLDIVNSTLSGNRADQWGGAIGANGGRLTINSSTLTNNQADANSDGTGDGGALSFPPKTVVSLFNSILAGNSRGSGTADDMTGGANLHKDSSNNLIGNSSITLGLAHGTKGNLLGNNGGGVIDINTVLDTTLKDNGGSAFSHSLIAGSPALDAGDASRFRLSVTTDQNGKPRVDGDGIDIGAFEADVASSSANTIEVDGVRFVTTGSFAKPLTKVTGQSDTIVAVGGGNVPAHVSVGNAIDGNPDTKYFQAGFTSASGLIVTPAKGATTVGGFRITTADDVTGRDPLTYKLEGGSSGSGPFTLISEGALNLPVARKAAGPTIKFSNSTTYTSYRLTFPTLRDSSSSAMQIADVELLGADSTNQNTQESGGSVQIGLVPTGGATFLPLLELRSGARIATNSSGGSTFSTTGIVSTVSSGRLVNLMSGVVDGDANQRVLIPVRSLTNIAGYSISDKQANTFRLSAEQSFTPSALKLVNSATAADAGLQLSGRLGFDALTGAGVRLTGANYLGVTVGNITAKIADGAIPVAPSSQSSKGIPAPISFDVIDMTFEAKTLTATYDSAGKKFEFKGQASTILDGGLIDVEFGAGTHSALTLLNGKLLPPSTATVAGLSVAGVNFNALGNVTSPLDDVSSFGTTLSFPEENLFDGTTAKTVGDPGRGGFSVNTILNAGSQVVTGIRIRTSDELVSLDPTRVQILTGKLDASGRVLQDQHLSYVTLADLPTGRNEWKTYRFKNSTASQRYVLNIEGKPNGQVALAELELLTETSPTIAFDSSQKIATVQGRMFATGADLNLGPVGFGVDNEPSDGVSRVGEPLVIRNGAISPFSVPVNRASTRRFLFTNRGTDVAALMTAKFSPATGEIRITGSSQTLRVVRTGTQTKLFKLDTFAVNVGLTNLGKNNLFPADGLRIANGALTGFSVPVESFTFGGGYEFKQDVGKKIQTPLTAKFDPTANTFEMAGRIPALLPTEKTLSNLGRLSVSTMANFGGNGTQGLVLSPTRSSVLSFGVGDITEVSAVKGTYRPTIVPFKSSNLVVWWDASEPHYNIKYSGSATWLWQNQKIKAVPIFEYEVLEGFTLSGPISIDGLQFSTEGFSTKFNFGPIQGGEVSSGTTVNIEGKAVPVTPRDENTEKIFFYESNGADKLRLDLNPRLTTPLPFPIDGIKLAGGSGIIDFPKTGKNPKNHFLYTTRGKVDFQVGDIKTKATISLPLELRSGGLWRGKGSTLNLDGTTIQNITFQDGDLKATYSEKDRRYVFEGTGRYLGVVPVTIGGNPKNAQLTIEKGTWHLTNFTPPPVDIVAGGVTFPTKGLVRKIVGDTVTFTASKTIDVGGAQITVELGGGGTNGLVVNTQTGKVQEISGTLSGTFTVGGVEISATGTILYIPATDEIRISGAANFTFNTTTGLVTVDINLGHGGTPGLVIKDGQVESIQASLSSSFKLFGLEVDVQNAGFSYNRAKQEYGIFGSVTLSTPDRGGQRILDNFSVTLGAPDTPGIIIKNGELEYLDIALNGSINLFGINATPENLRIVYTRSQNELALTGGLTVTVAGQFTAKAAFPGRGLLINTRTGEVQIKGLELRVQDVTFGTLEIRDLGFIYEVDDQGNTTISGSGEITLPAGLTVGAEVVVKNNRLKKIGFKVERSPGIPLGHPPVVFLNSIEGEIDNLDDLNNFSIKAKVTGTVGPSVKIFGQTRALVTIEGSIDINKDRMIIRGDVDLLEGIMGEGSGSITIFFKGKEVVHVTANFRLYPGGVFRGNLDFRMDRDFNITLNGNLGFYVPDPVPVVGGESLGNFGIYLQIRPTQRRENSYVRVSGDVTLAEFEVTVNFAGRLDGWAEPPILSRKHFGFYLPGARDLDFLLPLSEGNFDAIDALTDVPAPELTIDGVTPDAGGAGATITYSGTSQLPDNTTIDLFVDTVDSGFNGHLIAGGLAFQDGQQTFDWDDMAAFAPVPYDPNTKLHVYGLISDGTNIPVYTNYSAAITPPDLTPSIAMPAEQTFGANQPLVFSNNTSNAIVVADPLAQHNADSELVVTLHAGNGFLTLDPQEATPWQNISNPQDVDDDGGTSVSDALQIITMLNSPTMQNDDGTLPAQRSSLFGTPMYDVNGDGKVTAADAQGLTNYLLGGVSGTVTTTVFDNVEVEGNGSGSITLIGKAADINKVLDGLTYEPIENAFFDDTLTTTVNRNPEFYIDTLSASMALKPRALTVGTADGVEALPVPYVQGSGHASLLESVQVSSAAAGYIASATIAIGGFEAGKDVLELNILDQQELGIDATFDAASGMLRLTGFARVSEYRQAIGLVTFCSHGTGERMLTVTLGDQAANVGAAGVKVRITAVNQAPVVLPGMGGTYIVGSGASLALLPSISVRDSDSMTLESATVIVDAASFKEGEDVLSYDAMDGITGKFNAMKGELELTGSASAANYSAALLRIKYRNTSTAATTGIRDVSITVSDGHKNNSTTTVHQRLLVVSANTTLQGVTLGNLPTAAITTANDDGTFTLAPDLTLVDNDMVVDTLMGVDIAITGNFMPGDDFLDIIGLPVGMDSSYDVMSGVLSVTGAVPVDWYEYMLQQVTYSNRSMVRDGVARTVSFTVHDGFTKGTAQSMTVQAEAVPVLETGLGALVYESGKGSEVIDANISVMYKGNTTLTGATVEFTWDFNGDQDRLVFANQNGITGSFDQAAGILTLTGTAMVAQYQTALRSVQYMNTRTNPIAGLRQLAVQIQDGQKFSDEASLQINVDTVYVAPTIAITTTEQTFDEGNAPILVAETFTIAQQDAAAADGRGTVMLDGATISIDGYVPGEDVLDFTPFQGDADTNDPDDSPTNIDGEFDANLGQLLLTGHASLAEYQSVIRSITYENVSEAPTTDPRVIHIMMQAGALDGEAPAVTITVTSLNNPPTQVSGPPAEATLLENAIDSSLDLENIDYAPPSDKEPNLVYTVAAVPDDALGHVEFNDGTIAETDATYTLEQLRRAVFVPALNASGEGQFSFTVAGFNPILGIPDPAQLSESIDIKVNGVLTDHPSDAFIAQLHRDLLGRNATQEELDSFDDDQEFQIQRLNAVEAVQESREYRDALVTGIHQRLLNRAATAEELDTWSEPSSISLGDLPSLNEVLPTVMSSDEYFAVRGADSYVLFVDAIFEDLLTRLPTDLERENEVGLLEDGVERSEIVTAIQDSDEASAIVVKEVIGSLLRRAGGQFEVVDFARLLQDNGRDWLVNHFAASDEYFIRYGIQESADSRNAEDIHADLVRQWLAGEATVGNSVVTTDFEATGTLAIDGRGRGGGTLIASEYVLTAAHLVDGRDAQSLRFTVGGTSYGVSEVHAHDGYSLGFLGTDDGNDLAVLKLNRPVVDVAPVVLWQHELQTGNELTLVGFGPHPGDEGFGTKRSGTTTVDGLSPRLVTWTYDNADEATTVPGDSGSPQFILHDGTYYLASVASGGTHQALSLGDFAYNTRVDSYSAWIANIVRWPSEAVESSQATASEGQRINESTVSSFVAFNTNFNVELSGNDLVIEDISTTGQANAFIITTTATDVVISDAQQLMTTDVTGATGTGTHTITVPLSTFTGKIIVQSTGGDDSIEVTTPSRLVDIDAGTGNNSLLVNGSSGAEAEEFFIRNSTADAGSLEVAMLSTTGPYSVRAQNVANVTLNTGAGIDTVRPGDLSGLTTAPQKLTINLGDGDDVLAGENGTLGLIVNGGDGDDTLTGGPANDWLIGGSGDDTSAGGAGDDVYVFDVDDVIGADTITENASEGSDTLDFSATQFTTVGIDLRTIAQPQTVDTNGNLQLTLSDDIENITGGANGNAIIGDAGANVLIGGDGIDFVLGAGGDDQISGGPGQDTLRSDASGAKLDGGTGPDTTEFSNVNVTFPTNVPATFDISGTAAGTEYDQVRVFGDAQTVTLGGVDLQLNLGSYTPAINDTFAIVNLIASTSTISGTFNHGSQALQEGGIFVADGRQLSISYQGGDGNDVVLTFLQRLAGYTVTPASVAPTVTEAGATETFTVVLDVQPTSEVVINIASDNTGEGTVDKATLTFTNTNWNTPQTVTVTGVDDSTVDGNQTVTITLSVDDAASDNAYDAVADKTVTVINTDHDTAAAAFFVTGPVGNTTSLRPTVTWSPVTGALSYNVFVNIDNNGGNVYTQQNISSSETSLVIPQDLEFARYRVFVEANMPNSVVKKQDQGHTFVVDVKPHLFPLGATTETNPVLTWNKVPGASSYQVYINVPGNAVTATVTTVGSGNTVSTAVTTALARNDYKWWVRPVRDVNGNDYLGPWSDASEFSTGGRTKLTSPARNSTVTDTVPTLAWSAVPNAQSYEVYISKAGTGLVYRDAGITGTSIRTRTLENGDYSVWIRTTLADGSGVWGGDVSFTVNATATSLQTTPVAPTTPGFNTTSLLFTWQATSGATSYDLYLHNGTSAMLETGLTGTSWMPATALADSAWTWSIRPVDASGVGTWSTPTEFTTDGRTTVLTPGANTSDTTPEFRWLPVANAVTYEIQVNNQTTTTPNVIREASLTGTTFTPPTALAGGTYRVWVRAISSSSNGPWSVLKEFVVASSGVEDAAESPDSLLASLLQLDDLVTGTTERPVATPYTTVVEARGHEFVVDDSQHLEKLEELAEVDEQFESVHEWLNAV